MAELVRSYEALISDAAGELRAWVVEVCEEDDEGFVDDDDGVREEEEEEGSGLEFWEGRRKRKRGRDEIAVVRGSVEVALKKVKLVEILLGAVRKRRLAGDGLVAEGVLEEVVGRVKGVSEAVDDAGMGFYEDEVGEAVSLLLLFHTRMGWDEGGRLICEKPYIIGRSAKKVSKGGDKVDRSGGL